MTRRAQGGGSCVTVGMWGEAETSKVIFKSLLEAAGVGALELPEGVRLARRNGLTYLLNFNPQPTSVNLAGQELSIPKHDVRIEETL